MSSGFRSSCYWTDWNWANTENIRIDLSQRAEMLKVEDFIVLTNEYEATYTY
jgi:hypothetical protein